MVGEATGTRGLSAAIAGLFKNFSGFVQGIRPPRTIQERAFPLSWVPSPPFSATHHHPPLPMHPLTLISPSAQSSPSRRLARLLALFILVSDLASFAAASAAPSAAPFVNADIPA